MRLYHYTNEQAAKSISENGISLGNAPLKEYGFDQRFVSLTTDENPSGHGLPLGGVAPRNAIYCINKLDPSAPKDTPCLVFPNSRAYRVVLEFDDDDVTVINFSKLAAMANLDVLAQSVFKLSTLFPYGSMDLLSTVEQHALLELLNKGQLKEKSSTWFFCSQAISRDRVLDVHRVNDELPDAFEFVPQFIDASTFGGHSMIQLHRINDKFYRMQG